MTSRLFAPIETGGMTFANRIAVAPMCQYSADDGSATDWHLQHWMALGMSGAGMVTVEATGLYRYDLPPLLRPGQKQLTALRASLAQLEREYADAVAPAATLPLGLHAAVLRHS